MHEFPEEEAGKETSGTGYVQLGQILKSISAMASSISLLQVQVDRELQLSHPGERKAATLRRASTQAHQAGATGTRHTTGIFPPTPTPPVPINPEQTFQPAPALTPVHRTCETVSGVVATAPEPRFPGFPAIFSLLEDRANTTPQSRLERLATLPLG